ncbi:MAG: NUDIX hydrolase [candidate division Zixibacteria bacterium]|nr:NUDIX hydrolase [candidate division Zixibacteria bacterium]
MYVSSEIIADAEKSFGTPREISMIAPLRENELDFIRSTQKNGREHDITLLIFNAVGEIAVMNKHGYPAELFRPPSGGLNIGESFESGGKREAYEETGLEITLLRYLLRVDVSFESPTRKLHWVTHVFVARADTEKIEPHDTKEIREARWAPMAIFDDFRECSQAFDQGGIHYRRRLHDEILKTLEGAPI